jgi:death-on-curing protein
MRYLTYDEVVHLHQRIIQQSGGAGGLRDEGALRSAIDQPRMTFGGEELYTTLIAKASAIGFSIIQNHPFVDGNKRIGHAATEVFLLLNGEEIDATVDEQESIILQIAAGAMKREDFATWLAEHTTTKKNNSCVAAHGVAEITTMQ